MERFFIIVVEEFGSRNPSVLEQGFLFIKEYQQLFFKSCQNTAGTSTTLPANIPSLDWAVCVKQSNLVFQGSGAEEFQGLISSSFVADLPCEPWDLACFNHLRNRAVDIILEWKNCPQFWESLDTSNHVKIFQSDENQHPALNYKLYWRGALKIKDPYNPSTSGLLEQAELSYDLDELDLITSRVRGIGTTVIPCLQSKKVFCPYLEIAGAFNANSVPVIFYSATASFELTVNSGTGTFATTLNDNVSLLFRLDYTSAVESMNQWEKDFGETQSIHFLGHQYEGHLRLFVLRSSEQLQHLANVFARSAATPLINQGPNPQLTSIDSSLFALERMESEVRRLQLLALKTWLEQNGSIDSSTMDELLREVVVAVVGSSNYQHSSSGGCDALPDYQELTDADVLKWKLEKMGKKNEEAHDQLLHPTGRTVTVDVAHLIRSFTRNNLTMGRSPTKRIDPAATSRMKPTCDLETARICNDWPQCTRLKYHGINYNLSNEDERMEKQGAEYQEKWVSVAAESSSFCNPWSSNSSSTYQLSNAEKNRQPIIPAEVRTPRKQNKDCRDLAQLRKSPRLLAKTSTRPNTRRTPSKKNLTGPSTGAGSNKETFKQQLKGVIIRVLADQKITTQDPLFRTCANKLSVICMALLKDSKTTITPRQMFQVAKSQAKQVIQFVKP